MDKKIISIIVIFSLLLSASSLVFAANDIDNPYVIVNPPHSTSIGK